MLRWVSWVALAQSAFAVQPTLKAVVEMEAAADGTHQGQTDATTNQHDDQSLHAAGNQMTTAAACTKTDLVVSHIRAFRADGADILPARTVHISDDTTKERCIWYAIASHEGELSVCALEQYTAGSGGDQMLHQMSCRKTSGGYQGDLVQAAKANFASMTEDGNLVAIAPFFMDRKTGDEPGNGFSYVATLKLGTDESVFRPSTGAGFGGKTFSDYWCEDSNKGQKLQNFLEALNAATADRAWTCKDTEIMARRLQERQLVAVKTFTAQVAWVVRMPNGKGIGNKAKINTAALRRLAAQNGLGIIVLAFKGPDNAPAAKPNAPAAKPNAPAAKPKAPAVAPVVPAPANGVKANIAPAKGLPAASSPTNIGAAKKLAKANQGLFELNDITLKGISGTASVACVACVLLLTVGILSVKVRSASRGEQENPLMAPVE